VSLLCLGTVAAEASRLAGELDLAGLEKRLAQEKGRVVLLNFWATWCEPCREEFPALSKLQKAYAGKGLRVLGLSTDFASQIPAVETVLYGRDGKKAKVLTGQQTEASFAKEVQALLQ
jgi:thiol-disulfide isomerase/thioredoxin